MLLVDTPAFHVDVLNYASAVTRPLYCALGIAAGLLAILYNRALLVTLAAAIRSPSARSREPRG